MKYFSSIPLLPNFSWNSELFSQRNMVPLCPISLFPVGIPSYFPNEIWFLYVLSPHISLEFRVIFQMKCGSSMSYIPISPWNSGHFTHYCLEFHENIEAILNSSMWGVHIFSGIAHYVLLWCLFRFTIIAVEGAIMCFYDVYCS